MTGVALSDPIFLAYAKLIGGLLGAAGTILLFMTYILRRDVAGVWRTYRGWLFKIRLISRAVSLVPVLTTSPTSLPVIRQVAIDLIFLPDLCTKCLVNSH